MNKTAIKNFAVWARRKLIADITIKAGRLGITENGIAEALPQSTADLKFFDIGTKDYAEVSGVQVKQREALVRVIKEKERDSKSFKDAFQYVVEEVAYTWFNRLIAIRFMEVNDYLPSGIRVLSSENPSKNEPDFVTTPFETDLSFTPYEQDRVYQLKDENKWDELFRMLFIKQCNKLNEILPELFQKTEDYTELLLTISYSDTDGVIHHLVHDIDEKDFDIETIDEGTNKPIGQVEIIGWMYQYYISEKHEEVIDPLHGKTIKKEDIPAATQLFTTDWVVRYMVDNSLGRYWIERNPQSKLNEKLQFFVTPKSGKINYIDEKVSPEELSFFDPCMGSGHILVYAFDVLMEIYRECGYTIGKNKTGMIGTYRLEAQVTNGGGKFVCTGIGTMREAKENVDTAFRYLKANSKTISGTISVATKDFMLDVRDLNGVGMTGSLSLATFISLCSAALNKPLISSVAILGNLSIGGSLEKIDNLANTLQVCLDSGAKKILIPIAAATDMASVPAELMSKFNLIFYSTPEDAVFKALGVE